MTPHEKAKRNIRSDQVLTPFDEPRPEGPLQLSLSDVVERYGLHKNFILMLINPPYQIIQPERKSFQGKKEQYIFTEIDLGRIDRVLRLKQLGYKMAQIKELMGSDRALDVVYARNTRLNIEKWYSNPTEENWEMLLFEIASFRNEGNVNHWLVWYRVMTGKSFAQCAQELNLPSAENAKEIYEDLVALVGARLLQLLFLGGKRDSQ